jgi:hypothetical protein
MRIRNDPLMFCRAGQDFYGSLLFGSSFIFEPLQYGFGNLFSIYESFDPPSTPAAEVRVIPASHFYIKSMVFAADRTPYAHDPTGFTAMRCRSQRSAIARAGWHPPFAARIMSRPEKATPVSIGFGVPTIRECLHRPRATNQFSGNYLIDGKSGALSYEARHGPWHRPDIGADWTRPDNPESASIQFQGVLVILNGRVQES